MKIGLTYDLRSEYLAMGYSEEETAEFDRDETIAAIEYALRLYGFETERIGNIFSLVKALGEGKRWDLVFNIAEGLYGYSREAQIPALLEAYRIPYTFSDPLILSVGLQKATTKDLIRSTDVPTPDYAVVHTVEDVAKVNLAFPLFAKPLAEGTSKGIDTRSIINSQDQLLSTCQELLARYHQPVLVETYLPGREVTVGVVGTGAEAEVVGVLEVHLLEKAEKAVYSYKNKEQCEELVEYRLTDDDAARQAAAYALKVWEKLGCRDAGRVDFRADSRGEMNFLEINPLAGMHPSHSDLPIMWTQSGRKYDDLVVAIAKSALKRRTADKADAPAATKPEVVACAR
jgi:D-alanine-D-alanine ligase